MHLSVEQYKYEQCIYSYKFMTIHYKAYTAAYFIRRYKRLREMNGISETFNILKPN